ncbi:MAG: hypothetical protein ACRYFR_06425 [Janthinobacterium lividum]
MPDAVHTVTVEFGEPEHGWLSVTFRVDDFFLKLDASGIPVNPLEALVEALAVVAVGSSASVSWFLEPAECCFNFENQLSSISLTITEKANRGQVPAHLFQFTGSVKELLIPFYEALKQFTAHSYSEAHWPKLTNARVARLGQLLQERLT